MQNSLLAKSLLRQMQIVSFAGTLRGFRQQLQGKEPVLESISGFAATALQGPTQWSQILLIWEQMVYRLHQNSKFLWHTSLMGDVWDNL